MSLGPELLEAVVAACNAGAAEIAGGLGRTFDWQCGVTVGAPATFDPGASWTEPGLVVRLTFEGESAVALLRQSSGLLPDWVAAPDATGRSKLTTLAQELGMLALPESHMPDDFQAGFVPDLAAALARAGVAAGASKVPLLVTVEGKPPADLVLVWPAAEAKAAFAVPAAAEVAPPAAAQAAPPPAKAAPSAAAPTTASRGAAAPPPAARYDSLPAYSRSLLRVKVPLIVTLAGQKQPVSRILELGPGSILQFDKSCEEPLRIEVGGQTVGQGEAVKVGEKFGVRVVQMTLPGERFSSVIERKRG